MSRLTRYVLTRRVYTTLVGRGYKLVCKICEQKLHIGDCVESKPSKYRNRKFYHCDCYDDSFIDLPNGNGNSNGDENKKSE